MKNPTKKTQLNIDDVERACKLFYKENLDAILSMDEIF